MTAMQWRGRTVLITGGSGGLGAAFARALAARGADLVLVGRQLTTLRSVEETLRYAHGVRVTSLTYDLSLPGAAEDLWSDLGSRGIFIDGLINNAGAGLHGSIATQHASALQRQVHLNVDSVVAMTASYLGQVPDRRQAFVLNVASILGFAPIPYMAAYGAAKAFVISFTQALHDEHRGTGLKVLTLVPGPMETAFFDKAGNSNGDLGVRRISPDAAAARALSVLERRNSPAMIVTNGRRLPLLNRLLPPSVVLRLIGIMERRAMRGGASA